MFPAPAKVRFCVLVNALPVDTSNVKVPAVLPIVVAAPKETNPVTLLEPLRLRMAPRPPTPTPLAVLMASAIVIPPCKASVAPDVIDTPPALVPNAPLLVAINVPALIVIAPVLVLAPDTVIVPAPAFVNPIALDSVNAALINKSLTGTPSATV